VAVGLRAAGLDVRDPRLQGCGRLLEGHAPKLVAVVAEDALELPPGLLQVARDAAGEPRGLRGLRFVGAADDELGRGS